jgi:hypothetical protein
MIDRRPTNELATKGTAELATHMVMPCPIEFTIRAREPAHEPGEPPKGWKRI